MSKYAIMLTLLVNINSLVAQEICETNEDTIEDLNSITKCTIEKTEKVNSSGKTTKRLAVKVSKSTRYLKKRLKNKEVASLGSITTSGVKKTHSKSEISNSLSLKNTNSGVNRLKEKLSRDQLNNAYEFEGVDKIPLFNSCADIDKESNESCFNGKMIAHIQENFKYPQEALINRIEGNVWVRFVIDEDGRITNLKSLGPKNGALLKHEAERVIAKLPILTPAIKEGKKVLTKYGFPINFSLEQ